MFDSGEYHLSFSLVHLDVVSFSTPAFRYHSPVIGSSVNSFGQNFDFYHKRK